MTNDKDLLLKTWWESWDHLLPDAKLVAWKHMEILRNIHKMERYNVFAKESEE